jgi:adenylate kinase
VSKSLFLIIGAPGSGKTTDAQIIAKDDENIAHFSTGELLRAEIKTKSSLGKTIESFINKGNIVPVEIALEAIIKAIKSTTCKTILIDGYPRSIEQMIGLNNKLKSENDITLKGVIEVVVSDEVAQDRVLGRNRGIDDDMKVFEHRMKVYKEPLKDIENFYKKQNLLFKVNGNQDIKSVVEEINKIIL